MIANKDMAEKSQWRSRPLPRPHHIPCTPPPPPPHTHPAPTPSPVHPPSPLPREPLHQTKEIVIKRAVLMPSPMSSKSEWEVAKSPVGHFRGNQRGVSGGRGDAMVAGGGGSGGSSAQQERGLGRGRAGVHGQQAEARTPDRGRLVSAGSCKKSRA